MFSHKLHRNKFKINSLQLVPPNLPPEADDRKARSKQALKYLRQGLRGSFSLGVSIIVGWLGAACFGPKQSTGGKAGFIPPRNLVHTNEAVRGRANQKEAF